MSRQRVQQLAAEFLARADATGWFEVLYAEAGDDYSRVPWADLTPNPHLVEWSVKNHITGGGENALTVGCGYGDDAEFLAKLGFRVVAFDVSPTAITQCQRRFPDSHVSYQVADLLSPPLAWQQNFALVLESYTLQALPPALRPAAISSISSFVAPSGQLLVITRGREETDLLGGPPYPLTQGDLAQFECQGLRQQSFEDYVDDEHPPVRRFRVWYGRPT